MVGGWGMGSSDVARHTHGVRLCAKGARQARQHAPAMCRAPAARIHVAELVCMRWPMRPGVEAVRCAGCRTSTGGGAWPRMAGLRQ